MILLNSKSIQECNEKEYEIHSEENNNLINIICGLPNYNCIVTYSYLDIANKHKEPKIDYCSLHEFLDKIEHVDFKNGCDFCLDDNQQLTIIAYGQHYKIDEEYNIIKTKISFDPYDINKEQVNISPYILKRLQESSYAMTLN